MDPRQHTFSSSLGLFLLRVVAGGFMATHGWGKVQMVLSGNYAGFPDPIGLGAATSLVLAASAEFLCALLVVVGLGTRFAALPVVFTMGVAAFVAHRSDPWTASVAAERFMAKEAQSWASKEPALLFLAAFLTLALTGAGRFSVDAKLASGRPPVKA